MGTDAKQHKAYLENFQEQILLRFNNDFNTGILISREWFVQNINEVTNILSDKNEIKEAQTEINNKKQQHLKVERTNQSKT